MSRDCLPRKKSVLPSFCYSKAFWIILPILVTSIFSGFSAINAQLENINERITENEVTIAENNVPELKQFITREFDQMESKIDQNTDILLDNYRLLCRYTEGDC